MGTSVVSGSWEPLSHKLVVILIWHHWLNCEWTQNHEPALDKRCEWRNHVAVALYDALAPLVFLINGHLNTIGLEAFTFASLSVAVGLAPEMLPVIVTAKFGEVSISKAHKR
jgi:Mg2+-importing ATPase